jgi:hypothetical protein
VPEGISAVVQAVPPVWDGADAVVGDEVAGAVVLPPGAGADVVPEPDPALFAEPPEADADVLPAELVVPGVDPAPLFDALPEHPAVNAATPSAPTAAKTEIRFIEPNLSG